MKTTTRWTTAILFLATLMMTACASGGIDLSKLPIVIAPAAPEPKPEPAPTKPRATLAFEVLDEHTGAPIPIAFATCDDGIPKQANDDGYIAVEREIGIYLCRFEADGYQEAARRFQLVEGGRQFPVRLKSTKAPEPPPAPVPPVEPAPVPVVVPPVVTPPSSPLCAMRDSDPFGCVRQVAAIFPQLLQTNTYESCLEFTQRVLEVLGPDWGHVSKTAGESQSVPRGFTPIDVSGSDGNLYRITGVSHDAIKHRVTGQVVDLLGNASANSDPNPAIHGPARIQWAPVPPEHWRVNNPFLPAVPVR